jgi:transcriptional regulator with XRE-family HTH domain
MHGGDYVLMARRRAGLTQRELAERLGCRQATIARWERRDRQVSIDDLAPVASACGLQLDAHLAVEDRSWWPQIAMQRELLPIERVRRLTPAGAPDVGDALELLAAAGPPMIVIGEVAGALHGWPLVLRGPVIEVCARPADTGVMAVSLGAREVEDGYTLAGGVRLIVDEMPAGTFGSVDLARGADVTNVGSSEVRVAGLLDLLRIAEASEAPAARREALAYQAVLDVERAQGSDRRQDDGTAEEKIEAWVKRQTPVA